MELPLEIISDILLKSNCIILLKSISKNLNNLYSGIIEEYRIITQAITPKDIEEYLKLNPKAIFKFDYKNNMIEIKSFRYDPHNNNYLLQSSYHFNKIINFWLNLTHLQYESDVKLITNNELCNYDLWTIYNVLLNRTNSKYLAKKVCIDTFNYYCKLLTNEILWLYLFITAHSLYNLLSINWENPINYNIEKIKSYQYVISNALNYLPEDIGKDYYQYTNYIIKKI